MRTHQTNDATDKLSEIRSHYADQATKMRLEGVLDVLNDMLASKHAHHRFRMAPEDNSVLLFDIDTDEVIRKLAMDDLIEMVMH